MTDSRLAGADFVRAFACLMVLAHHVAQRISPEVLAPWQANAAGYTMMGGFGVAAFFILSGYLLARPFWVALDAGQPMPSLRTYVLRRGARILPAFYVALTVIFVLSFTLLGAPFDGILLLRYAAGLLLIFATNWLTWFPVEFNPPLWSIGCEIIAYALLPLCLWLLFALPFARGWLARLLWVGIIAAMVGGQVLVTTYGVPDSYQRGWEYGIVGGAKFWWPSYNPLGFYAIFAIGALAAGIQVRLTGLRHILFDVAAIGGFVLAGWSVAAHFPMADGFGLARIPYGFPLFPLGVALILVATPSSALLHRITENAATAYVARVSFGVYIWHYFLMEVVRVLWQPAYVYWGMRDVGQWAWISAGVVVASFIIATLSYRLIEEPVIRWARTLERRPTPVAPTLSPAAG